MAAEGEVPVYDVLNEAMEYLCKLGSNLRLRSETLRNKKIRKEKLRNSHAVQKAANKVLLICELSKKSLQNVEVGVKKVLSSVLQAQTSSGGDNVSPKHSSLRKSYEYIEYESKKLKIAKIVPLKHYMSVKVLARSMPSALLEKYPVYYDCKLYRLRNKKNKVKADSKEITVIGNDTEVTDMQKDVSECITRLEDDKSSTSEGLNRLENSESKNGVRNKIACDENKGDNLESNDEKTSETEVNNTECETNPNNESGNQKNDTLCISNSPHSSIGRTKENLSSDENSSHEVLKKRKETSERRPSKLNEKLKRKRIVISDDSSSDNESKKSKSRESDSNKEADMLDGSISENNITNREVKHKSKMRKKSRIVGGNSSDEMGKAESDISLKTDNEKTSQNDIKNSESNDVDSDANDKENRSSETKSMDEKDNNDKTVVPEPSKPLIKCVNLSKLLKPCILDKVVENTLNKTSHKDKILPKNKSKVSKKDSTRNSLEKEPENLEENYWPLKRKEVKAFKAKNFVINVYRLPKLTVEFLEKNNLNKITQSGAIICQKILKPVDNDVLVVREDPLDKRKTSECNISKVKNALLNDSDSDGVAPKLSDDPDRVKSALLQESDSDKNENTSKCAQNPDRVKSALLQESDSDKNENTSKCAQNPDKVKSALLQESDSDKNENTSKCAQNHQSSSDEDINTVSQKTKNALLTSSDSDKATNETAKNINEKSPVTIEPKSPINNETLQAENENNDAKNDNEKSTEQLNTPIKPDEVKSALLNSSDDNSPQKTPADKKRRDSQHNTPRSKRKHIMESMHAKKMLLTYSSSSETEDEQLRSVLKEIKDSLLKGISSDEEGKPKIKSKSHRRKLVLTSDSDEGSKKQSDASPKTDMTSEKEDEAKNNVTKEPKSDNEKSCEEDKSENESTRSQEPADARSSSSDRQSNSSRSKIGCTKTNSASSGSCHNSDTPDTDKDINGLTNLRTLNKIRRRRGSTSTASKSSRSLRSRRKMPKSPLISAENMLQAESSSEGGSGAESEAGEDLPAVTLAPINGGLGDLTKEDLLGESDSSSSKNDSDTAVKEESDENLKSKRRKANAISSDSEVGSSRRKESAAGKVSDFEDSEEESSEPAKKNKRKKVVDSDASAGSSDTGKKKRRRIKQVDSEGSGSDTENEGRNKHGRKNIRKVMGKNQLEEATKKAARQEKERIARIAERQKLYNNLEFDESGKPDEVVLEKVVLDFDPETKEPLIQVDRGLVKKLKPHQANGIKFMWDACFESVKRIKKDKGSGCILAHCMGLGKTLQVVSLTHTLLTHSSLTGVNRVLVVCPLSTVLNWVNEFTMWLKHAEADHDVDVYELSRFKQNSERAFQLQQWFEHGGVCVLGYEMFRNLSADNSKKFKKKMLRHFQESLVDPGPDLVVCDEGHLLKNEKTSLSQSMNRVKTLRRIVLTGTPLQNNLKEYYCMVQFVKPNLLGKYNEYLNRFVNPITNGQYTDSTEHDIRVMKRRSHVLHKMLDGAVQRRDYGVLAPFLPPKHEYVLFITLTDVQVKLYQYYLDNYSRRPLAGKSSGFLFPDFQSLQRIWTHPLVLKYNSERYEIMQQKKREREEEDSEGSLADFIDDDSTPDESSTEESTDDSSDVSDDSRKKSKKKKSPKKKGKESRPRRGTRANPVELEEEEKANEIIEAKNENPTEWWIKLVTEDELEDMRNSSKLVLLFDILRQCETIGDKLLVFSQSLYSLDLIEHFLGKVDEATQEGRVDEKLGGHVGSWSPGVDYFRLDGSTSCENRSIWCKNFNREDNPRARLFLISTRAGGLGINLVAANRVVIFDVSWNPSHDVQSIFRVYRFGQKKPCYIYRFLAMGTMEEKIYERQVTKQAISKRVIDEQQIDRHYAENDLAELYKFEATPPAPRPLPPLPKDRLFAEMLREHEAQIYKYHEHDSLLENKEEETLSEEERKAAWEDFENEKNRPPPAPAPMAWPGMVPGLLQQQQLAYAALAAMLRKDMPNINDQQIRDMLPLIYNANPGMFGGYDYGLMQKMGEIYKYAQPGMMNPGMMNPLMAGGGAGAGMGGTSGLQYEPPWQRQQQQQQQMRLQQILQQQQQNMGAKYYAGGLGSRDPVAMALQQQRAREIMVGERARPRGRPPLPRPAPPADVVNLDSD